MAIAAIVQASAAIVLIWFTIVALRTNSRMASAASDQARSTENQVRASQEQIKATQEQTRQAALPVIIFDIVDSPSKQISSAGLSFCLMVSNVGVGPALKLIIEVDPYQPDSEIVIKSMGTESALGPGAQIMAFDLLIDDEYSLITNPEVQQGNSIVLAKIDATYVDVFGRKENVFGRILYASRKHPYNMPVMFETYASSLPGATVATFQMNEISALHPPLSHYTKTV